MSSQGSEANAGTDERRSDDPRRASPTEGDGDVDRTVTGDEALQRQADSGSAEPAEESAADDAPARHEEISFPVVGVGASAGGLQAFQQLLQHLPADPGVALIFVQHLSPQHASSLGEILSRETTLPVQEATSGTPLQVNHIYVIPPDRDLAVFRGSLQLMDRPRHPARHLPSPTAAKTGLLWATNSSRTWCCWIWGCPN